MTKAEYIEKYGEEEGLIKWNDYLACERERYKVRKEQKLASSKVWYANNKEKRNNKSNEYYKNNKERLLTKQRLYYEDNPNKRKEIERNWKINYPKIARASRLTISYRQYDKDKCFDISNNITKEWVVDNIFTSKCVYCGDDNWEHLGCDRIDNTKPHTPENIVCACGICNEERSDKFSVEEFKFYRALHPRACDIPKGPAIQLSETGALKKRTIV